MNEIYPLGTVVKLNGNDVEIVICGYCRKEVDTGNTYNYVGINAAAGLTIVPDMIFFNAGDIESVIFKGYMDEDFDGFIRGAVEAAEIRQKESQ